MRGSDSMNDLTLLGPWVRRFLLEQLVAEPSLARNTQRSYRDALTLLIPFVADRLRPVPDWMNRWNGGRLPGFRHPRYPAYPGEPSSSRTQSGPQHATQLPRCSHPADSFRRRQASASSGLDESMERRATKGI